MHTKQLMIMLGIGIVAISCASCGGGGGGGGVNEADSYAPAKLVPEGTNVTRLTITYPSGEHDTFKCLPGGSVVIADWSGSHNYSRQSSTDATVNLSLSKAGNTLNYKDLKLQFESRNHGRIVDGQKINIKAGAESSRITTKDWPFTIQFD